MPLKTTLKKPGLPHHWQRGRQLIALLLLAVALLVTFALRESGRADGIDQWWLMARFTFRQWVHPPAAPDPDIVLVNMDDKCSQKWPEPFIGWGGHLAEAIHHLHTSGAQVIALDWTQPISTQQWFPGNDEKLAGTLNQAGSVVMIMFKRPAEGNQPADWVLPTPQIRFLLPGTPANDLGYAELNQQSVITGMTPAQTVGGETVKSLSTRIVEHYLGAEGQRKPGAFEIPGKLTLPLRADGTALINYNGLIQGQPAFQRYSLYDIANLPDRPDPRFRNKIVIIGVTFAEVNDQSYIPFLQGLAQARLTDGNAIQASQVRTLLHGNAIREAGPMGTWLLSFCLSLLGLLALYLLPLRDGAICAALALIGWIGLGLALFSAFSYSLPLFVPVIGMAATSIPLAIYRGLREERERRQVMDLWGRYQDPRIVDYLLQHPHRRAGEGDERQVTVLFADLKNFTKTVENLSPGDTLRQLNSYLGMMTSVILKHGGVIDKFLGDGLMAEWGMPEPSEDHARAAMRACLEMYQRSTELTHSIGGGQDVTFGVRLTLHSGPAIVGWVGATRMEFTIIGDTVNVTSRLQETAKQLDCEVLISESVYEKVKSWIRTGKETEVGIRGRLKPLKVYEVLGEVTHG